MSHTDFNDMAALSGLAAVKRAIASAAVSVMDEDQPNFYNATPGDLASLIDTDTETGEPNAALIKNGVSEVSGVQANNGGLCADTPADIAGVSAVSDASKIPGTDARPCFRVFDDWLEHNGGKYQPGVWYFGIKPG